MKSNITYLLLLFFSIVSGSLYAQNTNSLLLTNVKTKKSINILVKNDPDKVEAILGKAITLDKDVYEKDAPVFTFNYNGLIIEMQNEMVKQITITNKSWKLGVFAIDTLLEEVVKKHEKISTKYVAPYNFKLQNSNGIIFLDVDNLQRITKLGVIFH